MAEASKYGLMGVSFEKLPRKLKEVPEIINTAGPIQHEDAKREARIVPIPAISSFFILTYYTSEVSFTPPRCIFWELQRLSKTTCLQGFKVRTSTTAAVCNLPINNHSRNRFNTEFLCPL